MKCRKPTILSYPVDNAGYRNAYRNPFSAIPRIAAWLKPNCRAASRYSPASVQPNMAGSSVFSTIGTPAS